MLRLTCAIVGKAGVFGVKLGDGDQVWELKNKIKGVKEKTIECDPDKLQLFLGEVKPTGPGEDQGTMKEQKEEVEPMTNTEEGGERKANRVWLDGAGAEAVTLDDLNNFTPMEEPTMFLNSEDLFGTGFMAGEHQIHVLVVVPISSRGSSKRQHEDGSDWPAKKARIHEQIVSTVSGVPSDEDLFREHFKKDVVWFGRDWSVSGGPTGVQEGVDLIDPETLYRPELTAEVIGRLDDGHTLLVESPPMTGKTSLASLVCEALKVQYTEQKKKVALFSFTLLGMGENTFEAWFRKKCKVPWDFAMHSLQDKGFDVYVVVDEVQRIYREGQSSPSHKSAGTFWEQVKALQSERHRTVKILMLAAYGSSVEYLDAATPVNLANVLDIDWMRFSFTEIQEYVCKAFKDIECFVKCFQRAVLAKQQLEAFCKHLEILTGGLCVTAVRKLKVMAESRDRRLRDLSLPQAWIDLLREEEVFTALSVTRAVQVLELLKEDELCRFERLTYGVKPKADSSIVMKCIRCGVLTKRESDGNLAFSSKVMLRYFVRKRVGYIERALTVASSLPDLLARVMAVMNYGAIRDTMGKSLETGTPLESVWQMEFYESVHRCTPNNIITSPNVGALFGSSGSIDFAVEGPGDLWWGFELLREANKLDECTARFKPDGKHSPLMLNHYCVIDFRRVSSWEKLPKSEIQSDMTRCERFFVVCYDEALEHVAMFDPAMEIIYFNNRVSKLEV